MLISPSVWLPVWLSGRLAGSLFAPAWQTGWPLCACLPGCLALWQFGCLPVLLLLFL